MATHKSLIQFLVEFIRLEGHLMIALREILPGVVDKDSS